MKRILIFPILLLLLFSGCVTTTKLTSSWKAEDSMQTKIKKVVVLGLIREYDRTLREKMEEHLVNDLKALGYDAVCACNEYNPKAFDNMSEEQAIDKLRSSGVDAVLTIVLLDKTSEKYYVPGRVQYSSAYYQSRFWHYTRLMMDRIYEENYYVTNTKYFWESNLYELKESKLLYSAQSQSFDPSSTESLGHEYGQLIIKDLVTKKVLAEPEKSPVMKAM